MSDSLRDQLLQAGFKQNAKEPAKNKQRQNRKPKKTGNAAKAQRQPKVDAKSIEEAAIAERKAVKVKIKSLIETSEIKEFSGETVYRFTLQNRIRELHVKEDIRKQLVDGVLTITRLNGSTRLVPNTVVDQIRVLNPDWAIVSAQSESSDDNEGYENFAVPDDIVW